MAKSESAELLARWRAGDQLAAAELVQRFTERLMALARSQLSDKLARNPEEYIEAEGKRYIYFNSPRLAAPARPLGEPKPRYPSGKLEQKDGAVMLQLLIDEKGELQQASVVCAARGFEKSAVDSVKGLKFRPARGKDGPVRSYLLVEFGYGRGFPCIPAPFY